MEIKHFDTKKVSYEDTSIDDNDLYAFKLNQVNEKGLAPEIKSTKQLNVEIVLTGKEIKAIVELINTFTKLQDNPLPKNLFSMFEMLQNFKGGNKQ